MIDIETLDKTLDSIDFPTLDVFPRLEIRWFKEEDSTETMPHYRADYMLVLSAPDKLDIRSNVFSDIGESYGEKNVEYVLGSTNAYGGASHPVDDYYKKLRTPFRDGVHVINDSHLLKLSAYVSYGKYWEQL